MCLGPTGTLHIHHRRVSWFAVIVDAEGDLDWDVVVATGAGFGNMTVWLENDGKAVPSFTLRNISAVQQNVSRVVSGDLDLGVYAPVYQWWSRGR